MRRQQLLTLAALGLAGVCHAAQIGQPAITPSSTPVGVPATITISTPILDPSVVASSVNLQQLDAQGRIVKVIGNLVDDGTSGDATAADGVFSIRFTVFPQTPGSLTYRVSAGVLGALNRIFSSPVNFTVTGAAPTGIAISQPSSLTFTNISPITVAGTAGDPGATVQVNGITATRGGNAFQASVPLQEGINPITAVATNTNGTTSTADIEITLDTTPPHVTIDSPSAGFITSESAITVSGIVNDLVVGTVNDQQATVTVNGVAAQVSNRRYMLANVALAMGSNSIQVVARDRTGNSATAGVTVTRQPAAPQSIRLISGNNQIGTIGQPLAAPFVVQLFNGTAAVPNTPVVFKIIENDGILLPGNGKQQLIMVKTDAQGQARATLTLGHRSGAGNNTVQAYAPGFDGVAVFAATGTPQAPAKILIDSGNSQFGPIGQPLAFPFVAVVTDASNNRLSGVAVTFTIQQGGGSFGGASTAKATTDGDGRALAVLTLGPDAGQDNNIVQATFAGNPGPPATFTASAKTPGDPSQTGISGIVVDNSNNPIANVTMRLFRANQGINNNQPMQIGTPVPTDAKGFFRIAPAPVGLYKLMADGSTTTQPNVSYPTLEYDIVTVAGQDNTVGMPIYLPRLDPAATLCVSPTTGGVLKPTVSPGFSLTIQPGAATFPGGSRTGCVSVSPVNPDKVPMTPTFGQQPQFVVTIQPVGTMFNPPAAVTVPNTQGLAPHSKTELFSFDHALSTFVSIGSATVSADGSVIASDPGVGVLKAGWFDSGSPPPPPFNVDPIILQLGVGGCNVPPLSSGSARVAESVAPRAAGDTCPNPGPDPDTKLVAAGDNPPYVAVGDSQVFSASASVKGTYAWTSSDPSVLAIRSTPGSRLPFIFADALKGGKATLTVVFTSDDPDANGVRHSAATQIDVICYQIDALSFDTTADLVIPKPDVDVTEIEVPLNVTVKVVAGAVNGGPKIPVPLTFTFEDPADSSKIVDPFSTADDNAPIANGGKRGTGSVMWRDGVGGAAIEGGQKLSGLLLLAPGQSDTLTVKFLMSAIAGDNYIVHVQATTVGLAANARVLKKAQTGTLTVIKNLTFDRNIQMTGGADITTLFADGVINPTFQPDGFTFYHSTPPVLLPPGPRSPEFLVPIQPPNASELPTQAELDQYNSPDPSVKAAAAAAISAKAFKWASRVTARNLLQKPDVLAQAESVLGVSVSAFGIVGVRAFSEKEDGDPNTGQTNFYPAGITIPVGPPTGDKFSLVSPDGDWAPFGAFTPRDGTIWIAAKGLDPQLQLVTILQLVALNSDHEPFGANGGDVADSGLMSANPAPTDIHFSRDSILRLRGWTRAATDQPETHRERNQ